MYLAQLPIAVLIFMVLAFGVGFILNMLVKSTWLPIYAYVIVVGFFLFRVGTFNYLDVIVLSGGLVGAVVSAVTTKLLRKSGYRYF